MGKRGVNDYPDRGRKRRNNGKSFTYCLEDNRPPLIQHLTPAPTIQQLLQPRPTLYHLRPHINSSTLSNIGLPAQPSPLPAIVSTVVTTKKQCKGIQLQAYVILYSCLFFLTFKHYN